MHQGTHRRIILLAVVTALAGVVSPVWATADAASTAPVVSRHQGG